MDTEDEEGGVPKTQEMEPQQTETPSGQGRVVYLPPAEDQTDG